jgi:hypothetical protein
MQGSRAQEHAPGTAACSLLMSAGGDLMMNSREWVAAAHRIPEDTNRDRSTILQMLPGTVTGTREVPTALSCS